MSTHGALLRRHVAASCWLAWKCRWAVAVALVLAALLIGCLNAVFVIPPHGWAGSLMHGAMRLVLNSLLYLFPAAIVLHAAGHAAMGRPATVLESTKAALLCQPRLFVLGMMALGCFFIVDGMLRGTFAVGSKMMMPFLSDAPASPTWQFTIDVTARGLALGTLAYFVALAPVFAVVERVGPVEAWFRSARSASSEVLLCILPGAAFVTSAVVLRDMMLWMMVGPDFRHVIAFLLLWWVVPASVVIASVTLIPIWRMEQPTSAGLDLDTQLSTAP